MTPPFQEAGAKEERQGQGEAQGGKGAVKAAAEEQQQQQRRRRRQGRGSRRDHHFPH